MTIEIRQLVVRAVVEGRPAEPRARAADRRGRPGAAVASSALPCEDRESLLGACVREVLRRLERTRER